MPDPTLIQASGNSTLRPLVQAWAKRVDIDDQLDFLLDVNARKPAQYLFDTYIAVGAPKLLNLGSSNLAPAREQVTRDNGMAGMMPRLESLYKQIVPLVEGGFNRDDAAGFLGGVEYLKFRVKSRPPALTQVVTARKIKGAKADQFNAFLKIYLKPRSVEDAYKAYVSMQKFANKANLDKALTHAGKPSLPVVQQYQALKLVPSIEKYQDDATDYLTTAIATVKSKGKPKNPIEVNRMFQSGSLRVTKANNDYVKAVRLDKVFAKKQAALAAEKKKIDELWADYRQLLGK